MNREEVRNYLSEELGLDYYSNKMDENMDRIELVEDREYFILKDCFGYEVFITVEHNEDDDFKIAKGWETEN